MPIFFSDFVSLVKLSEVNITQADSRSPQLIGYIVSAICLRCRVDPHTSRLCIFHLESSAKKPTELAGIFQFELKTCTMYIRVTICPKGFQIGTKCNACNATVRPVVVV